METKMKKKYVVGVRIPYPLGEDEPSFYGFETKEASDEFIEEVKKKYQGVEIRTAVDDGVAK